MMVAIRNWRKFQHYKFRRPRWIKLHTQLLNDPAWFALSGDASKMLANCWLLASEANGELPSNEIIAFRLHMTEKRVSELLSQLTQWLEPDASKLLAECKQDASTEYREQSSEKEEERKVEAAASKLLAAPNPKKTRGERLRDDWRPSSDDLTFAGTHGLTGRELNEEIEKFRDYWRARAGPGAVKLDWSATWRNWIRKREENGHGAARPNGKSPLSAAFDKLVTDAEAAEGGTGARETYDFDL